jgi:hypothetical protein
MLLSDFTYINTNNRNYKKFVELGYIFNIGDKLMVKTTDLNTGSKEFVSVKCDICNSEKSIMYFSYIQNTEKYNIYACTEGNEHHYYPDFYIEEFNMICEIKSDYYYKLDESRNICKKIYTEKSGYNFIFIINKNYDELKKITTINDTTL